MSARIWITEVHVVLSCAATLAGLAAVAARRRGWRRLHATVGRCFLVLVLASGSLVVGLAAASGNRFGVVFTLQPMVLVLSAAVQFRRTAGLRRALGALGVLVVAGVYLGFARFLLTRELIDVVAFPIAGGVVGFFALQDMLGQRQPGWSEHSLRMLAACWFYMAELLIFVFDPQPSVLAWAMTAMPLLVVIGLSHRRPPIFGVPGRR
jgi:hypothetical protein